MGAYLDLDDVAHGNPKALEELAALRQRCEDLDLMLRAALADRFTRKNPERWHGDHAISEANVAANNKPWLLYGDDAKLIERLADNGTGLPILTDESRAALRKATRP